MARTPSSRLRSSLAPRRGALLAALSGLALLGSGPAAARGEPEDAHAAAERKHEPKAPAHPPPRRAPSRREEAPRAPARLEVPVDIGVGPVLLWGNPPLGADQLAHFALGLEAAAVVDRKLLRRFEGRSPPKLRDEARALGQVRIRPWWLALIPEELVISPQLWNTGVYGAVWRPLGLGVSFLDEPVRVSADAALDLAYLFIHSKTLPEPTHFLRPGVNLRLNVEIPLGESVLLSTGWSSDLFVPQPLGRPPWEVTPLDSSLWHLGGPYLLFHYRFPLEVSL